jgi:hypothetical protein
MGQMKTNFSYNTSQGIPEGHINYTYQLSEDPLPTGLCMFHSLHFLFPTASSWLNFPSTTLFQIRHEKARHQH